MQISMYSSCNNTIIYIAQYPANIACSMHLKYTMNKIIIHNDKVYSGYPNNMTLVKITSHTNKMYLYSSISMAYTTQCTSIKPLLESNSSTVNQPLEE